MSIFKLTRIVSESIPWLVVNKKFEEAEAVMRKAAKINKITLPATIFKRPATINKDSNVRIAEEAETKTALLITQSADEDRYNAACDVHIISTKSSCGDVSVQGSHDTFQMADKHSDNNTTDSSCQNDDDGAIKYGLRDIFRSRTLLLYASVLVFMW